MNIDSHLVNDKVDRKTLRSFGLTISLILVILFGVVLPWLRTHSLPRWPWIVGAVLSSLALISPMSIRLVYRVWMRIGLVLGFINTRIILGIIYYGLLTPMGWIMHWVKKENNFKGYDSSVSSYRLASSEKAIASMEKPF